jgi:hypothetical protein
MGVRRDYSLEDIERGLTAIVLAGGSDERARRALADQGHRIPRETLRDWRAKHADRYEQLRVDLSGSVAQRIASEAEALAVQYAEKEAEVLASLDAEQIAKLAPKERSDTLRNLAVSKSLQLDKVASPLRGRPTQILERRTPEDLLRQIDAIVGNAVDITDSSALPPSAPDD